MLASRPTALCSSCESCESSSDPDGTPLLENGDVCRSCDCGDICIGEGGFAEIPLLIVTDNGAIDGEASFSWKLVTGRASEVNGVKCASSPVMVAGSEMVIEVGNGDGGRGIFAFATNKDRSRGGCSSKATTCDIASEVELSVGSNRTSSVVDMSGVPDIVSWPVLSTAMGSKNFESCSPRSSVDVLSRWATPMMTC